MIQDNDSWFDLPAKYKITKAFEIPEGFKILTVFDTPEWFKIPNGVCQTNGFNKQKTIDTLYGFRDTNGDWNNHRFQHPKSVYVSVGLQITAEFDIPRVRYSPCIWLNSVIQETNGYGNIVVDGYTNSKMERLKDTPSHESAPLTAVKKSITYFPSTLARAPIKAGFSFYALRSQVTLISLFLLQFASQLLASETCVKWTPYQSATCTERTLACSQKCSYHIYCTKILYNIVSAVKPVKDLNPKGFCWVKHSEEW